MIKIHRHIHNVEDVVSPKVEHEVQSIRVIEERPKEKPQTAPQKETAKGGKKTSKKRV